MTEAIKSQRLVIKGSHNYWLSRSLRLLVAPLIFLLLASCGPAQIPFRVVFGVSVNVVYRMKGRGFRAAESQRNQNVNKVCLLLGPDSVFSVIRELAFLWSTKFADLTTGRQISNPTLRGDKQFVTGNAWD